MFAICFCISSYVQQQLHSLDCQHFVHYISLVLFTFLRTPHGCRVSFLKGTYNFQLFKMAICKGACTLKCTEKRFIPFASLICPPPPTQNSREALHMAGGMYCTILLLEIIRLSDFSSPLFYPSLLGCDIPRIANPQIFFINP